MKKLIILLFITLLPIVGMAGSRGVSFTFVDASPSNDTAEGKRLAELLVMDMKDLYTGEQVGTLFPWNENTAEIKVMNTQQLGLSFDRLINVKSPEKVQGALEKAQISDGLIVFYYDRANGYARLKLFGSDGSEQLLVRLPLEGKSSAMKHSLMKGHRRGVLSAIGSSVRWGP